MAAQDLLDRLEKYKQLGEGKWIAVCPAHNDLSPSLAVDEMPDGKVLLKCWSGCSALDVITAVGLDWSTLFPETSQHYPAPLRRAGRESVDDFIVELGEYARESGKRLTEADKKAYADALKRGGKRNGFVDKVKQNSGGSE
ncbi:MAG: virulence-associated protein E [Acidimicrobiales bacterium]